MYTVLMAIPSGDTAVDTALLFAPVGFSALACSSASRVSASCSAWCAEVWRPSTAQWHLKAKTYVYSGSLLFA
jgi:hypothetical protein